MKVLVTGSQGFVGSYICQELLANGYDIIGIDNYSKYGVIKRAHDDHKNFRLLNLNLLSLPDLLDSVSLIGKVDIIVCTAAEVGGTEYLNSHLFDLLNNNNIITSNTFVLARCLKPKHIIMISSLMAEIKNNIYAFQKLSCEHYAKAFYEQYKIPYTNLRISNCVGIGEDDNKRSDIKYTHVIPDLIKKLVIDKQEILELLGDGLQRRYFTNGKDIAKAVEFAINNSGAINQTLDITYYKDITILEVAMEIWKQLRPNKPFKYKCIEGFKNDPKSNNADWKTTYDKIGFKAKIDIEQSIKEVIEYIK